MLVWCLVAKSCLTLWDPMDCSPLDFPVLLYLLQFAQTRVHWVSDAIQPSHPQPLPFPPALNLSQHQGLFQWVNSASGDQNDGASTSASAPLMNIQGWFPLGLTGLISLQSKRLLRVFSRTRFKSINSLVLSLLYGSALTSIYDYWKAIALTIWTFVSKVSLLLNMLSGSVIAFLPKSKHLLIHGFSHRSQSFWSPRK